MREEQINQEEVTADELVDFIRFCKSEEVSVNWNSFLPMIRLKFLQRPELAEDPLLVECVKGIKKIASLTREIMEQRLPFPSEAIQRYCASNIENSIWFWLRNKAIITLAFRAMRRPCELGYLKRKHISFEGGYMHICIPKSKTDQLRRGRWIPIDATGGQTCPVHCMRDWLNFYQVEPESWLFPGATGAGSVTGGAINELVKKIMRTFGFGGRYTGHSLRIGGATAALKGGLTIDQIRSIGDWQSDAVLLYLRASAVAELGGSSLMGL